MKIINKKRESCEICGKKLGEKRRKYCSKSCNDKSFYRRNKEKYKENARRWERANPIKRKMIGRRAMRKFLREKGERFRELMKKGYEKHKDRWRERCFASRHKLKIIDILQNKCQVCGKIGIKEIHHKNYHKRNFRLIPGPSKKIKEENMELLVPYVKNNLTGVCSKKCHLAIVS